MDHSYRIDVQHSLALVRFGTSVTGLDIVALLEKVLGDPKWKPGYARLWDGRRVRHLDVQPQEITAHGEFLDGMRKIAGDGKSAIVASRDIDLMAAKLYRERVQRLLGVDVRVFDNMNDAVAFLDVPAESCEW
jgi:hypothetical protein